MKPGRELDALVAEKVMGWEVRRDDAGRILVYAYGDLCLFEPSTDIAAAWQVVEKLHGESWHFDHHYFVGEEHPHEAFFAKDGMNDTVVAAESHTGPHAICLAALRAVGEDV